MELVWFWVWKTRILCGSLGFCMETKIFVWFVWIVMGWYEFVDFYMKFLLELRFEVLKSVITC